MKRANCVSRWIIAQKNAYRNSTGGAILSGARGGEIRFPLRGKLLRTPEGYKLIAHGSAMGSKNDRTANAQFRRRPRAAGLAETKRKHRRRGEGTPEKLRGQGQPPLSEERTTSNATQPGGRFCQAPAAANFVFRLRKRPARRRSALPKSRGRERRPLSHGAAVGYGLFPLRGKIGT